MQRNWSESTQEFLSRYDIAAAALSRFHNELCFIFNVETADTDLLLDSIEMGHCE